MVHAMADLGSELRLLLAARGMSLNELARQAPCDPGYLSKVVRGQKRASPRLLARLDEILGADGAITALAGSPPTAAGDLDLIELARRAEVSDVGPATLGLLETATDGLCRDYSGADPAQLAARARQHLRYVTKLIGGRVTLTQHRELLVIAGWLSAVLACASYDMSDTASARIARTMTAQFAAQAATENWPPGPPRSDHGSRWSKDATAKPPHWLRPGWNTPASLARACNWRSRPPGDTPGWATPGHATRCGLGAPSWNGSRSPATRNITSCSTAASSSSTSPRS